MPHYPLPLRSPRAGAGGSRRPESQSQSQWHGRGTLSQSRAESRAMSHQPHPQSPSRPNVLSPVPEVGVVAKRPQGLLHVGGLFPRGWRCCVPALLTSSALRFSLLLGNLLFSNFPLATTPISSLTPISKNPPPHFPFFRTTMSFIPIEARSSRKS
jgi:hypothetical protein